MLSSYRSYCSYKYAKSKSGAQLTLMRTIVIQGVVKQKTMFSSAVGHSGAHWSKLRTTFGFSRIYNCNKIYNIFIYFYI